MKERYGYLKTDHCFKLHGKICRRERHYSDTGKIFVPVDIFTGVALASPAADEMVEIVPRDQAERIIFNSFGRERKKNYTKRQTEYVRLRIEYPKKSMAQCAREAGYSEKVVRVVHIKVEAKVKKLFSAYLFLHDKRYASQREGLTPECERVTV